MTTRTKDGGRTTPPPPPPLQLDSRMQNNTITKKRVLLAVRQYKNRHTQPPAALFFSSLLFSFCQHQSREQKSEYIRHVNVTHSTAQHSTARPPPFRDGGGGGGDNHHMMIKSDKYRVGWVGVFTKDEMTTAFHYINTVTLRHVNKTVTISLSPLSFSLLFSS